MKDVNEENELKYLEFVQASTIQAVLCASKMYDFAKDYSGPLKPGVESVEGTVKTVVGPVYDKYHDVPYEVLKFVDRKVDESATKIDSYVPPVVRQVSFNAMSAAQKAPAAARSVASDVKTAGVIGTASELAKTVYTMYEPTAKGLYDKYEPVAEQYAASAMVWVDESATKIDSYVPPVVRQVSFNAMSAAQKAPAAARSVASEVKTAGVIGTASGLAKTVYTMYEPAAKEIYDKYEPVAEQYAASAWRRVNSLPLVPRMAEAVAPTASFYTEKYNQTVQLNAEKGYKVASILPLVPTEKIAKVLNSSNDGHAVSS